jgi:prefoldin beta subunit
LLLTRPFIITMTSSSNGGGGSGSGMLPSHNPGTILASTVDEEMAKFRQLQESLHQMRADLQTLQSQATENEMVLQELKLLNNGEDESSSPSLSSPVVYKLMGPALIRQSLSDAVDTVTKRIEFIVSEQRQLTQRLQDKESAAQTLAQSIQQMQSMLQQTTVQAVQAIAAQHQKA